MQESYSYRPFNGFLVDPNITNRAPRETGHHDMRQRLVQNLNMPAR